MTEPVYNEYEHLMREKQRILNKQYLQAAKQLAAWEFCVSIEIIDEHWDAATQGQRQEWIDKAKQISKLLGGA